MTLDYSVEDNFLDIDYFNTLKKLLQDPEFPWYWRKSSLAHNESLEGYHTHNFFTECITSSPHITSLHHLFKKINLASLIEARANAVLRVTSNRLSDWHSDRNFSSPFKTSILYFNKCDGPTYLKIEDKEIEVESIPNRLLTFDGQIKHRMKIQSDIKRRIILNLNYFKKT